MNKQIPLQHITIRPYIPEDAQALANIYYYTIHRVNIKHYTQEQVNAWAPETSLEGERWKEKFAKTRPLIALINGVIVGFAEFEFNGHIDCFYCHHDWIGHGVGSALMRAINEKAHQLRIKHIFVEVSITAKPFFEKQGFVAIQEQVVVIKGIPLTNYKMEKFIE